MKEKPNLFPQVYSKKFPDGFKKTDEQCFVPWSEFRLMQEAFEKAKAFIDVNVACPDTTPEMIVAYGEYVDTLEKLEKAKVGK